MSPVNSFLPNVSYQVVAFYRSGWERIMGICMSIDPTLLPLIYRGKKPRALSDIIHYFLVHGAATVAILDHEITDLGDKAIRNFLVKLEGRDFITISDYKIPGDRWVQLFIHSTFELHELIKKHKATRKKKSVYKDVCDTLFICDIPFEIHYRNNREYDLVNRILDLRFTFYDELIKDAAEKTRITLRKMQFKKPNKLEKYLKIKEN